MLRDGEANAQSVIYLNKSARGQSFADVVGRRLMLMPAYAPNELK